MSFSREALFPTRSSAGPVDDATQARPGLVKIELTCDPAVLQTLQAFFNLASTTVHTNGSSASGGSTALKLDGSALLSQLAQPSAGPGTWTETLSRQHNAEAMRSPENVRTIFLIASWSLNRRD